MSAPYTRGPWKYGTKLTASENHRGFFIYDWSAHTVADVMPRDSDGVEGEANARLIAAAPELLEALKKALHALDDFHVLAAPTFQPALAKTSAAIAVVIAKATGDAQ